jgi:hypothetical protein
MRRHRWIAIGRSLRRPLKATILIGLLAPSGARADSIVLHWTAPGDDGNSGTATSYELRYSETAVPVDTAGWWGSAISVGPPPIPQVAGTRQSFTVAGLDSGRTYFFIIRAADEVPNWSGYSNVAVRSTGSSGGPLLTPSGFSAQLITGGVSLSWNQVTSGAAVGYHIYRRASGSAVGTLMATTTLNQTSWIDSTVIGGEIYEYDLTTYAGTSDSPPAAATVAVPGDLLASATTDMIGYPNPARGKVTLRFHGGNADGTPGRLRLVIYDLTGHKICELLDGSYPAGERAIEWLCRSDQGNPVAPGLYTAILDTPVGRHTTRLAILP